jgi:hypothetical protein
MTPLVYTYLAYVLFAVTLTIWVARTLHRNGRIFLVDAFGGNEPLADSVNHLLVVGFYLINFAYMTLALKSDTQPADVQGVIETLSVKIGGVLLILGGMHFLNLIVFSKMRTWRLHNPVLPPIPQP